MKKIVSKMVMIATIVLMGIMGMTETVTAQDEGYNLTVTITPFDGGGALPTCGQKFTTTTLTAFPAKGFMFSSWSVTPTGAAVIENERAPNTTITLSAETWVMCTFVKAQITYTVIFSAAEGGVIEGDDYQTVKKGGNCTPIKAVPENGKHFKRWNGRPSLDNPLTVKNVNSDLSIIAEFELDDDTNGIVTQAKLSANHSESFKTDVNGVYVSQKDTYTLMVKAKLSDTYDLSSIDGTTVVFIETEDGYTFSSQLSKALQSRINTPSKGGSATFITTDYDAKNNAVKVDTINVVWDKMGTVTFKVNGHPLIDTNTNIVDLTGEADGTINGTLNCRLSFGIAEFESLITYHGKKKTKASIDDSVEDLVSWTVSGKQ